MAPITGSVTSTCKPTSTNSPSASTGGSIRSTPSVPCSASRAALPHRPMQSFTPVPGSTLHLGGVGKKRIGKEGLINLLGWSRRERERLQMQREMLQSGKFKLLKDEGSGPIDVSSQN